jgi:chromate transport protein ChrA
MSRYIMARIILTLVGIAVWGYGQRVDQPQVRMGGIVILAFALLMRFAPKRWFDEESS